MSQKEKSKPPEPPPLPPLPTPFGLPQWLEELDDPFVEKRYQKELQFRMVGAIEKGNVELLQKLIGQGVNTNCVILLVKTPLTHTVDQDDVNYDIVKLLLDSHAETEQPDKTPWGMKALHTVCAKGLVEIAKLFVAAGADVNVKDRGSMTPLHFAAKYNQVEIVKYLLKQSAYVHAVDNCGKTPLHRATEERNFEIVELFLEAGADINSADNHGWTPIFHSVFFHHSDMVQFLILNGADVNHLNDYDESPLHIACSVEMPTDEIFEAVVRSSFDFYRRSKKIPSEELKSLMETRLESNLDVVKLLVNAGADVNTKTTDNESPVLLADNVGVKRYLAAAGGRLDEDDLMIFSFHSNRYLYYTDLQTAEDRSQLCSDEDYRHLTWLNNHFELQYTLKYMCRTAVRKYLGVSRDITGAIETLQLPKALKGFLNLEDFSEVI